MSPLDFFEPMKVNLCHLEAYGHAGDAFEPMKITEFVSFQCRPSGVAYAETLPDSHQGSPSKTLEEAEMEHCLLSAPHLSL